ncbi:hypothetical protein QEN19_000399 [Hanseniaspora menglaensis]
MLRHYYNKAQNVFNDLLTILILASLLFTALSYYHFNYYKSDEYANKSGLNTTLSINKYQYKNRSSKNFGGNNKENLKILFDLNIQNFNKYLTNYKYNLKQIFLYLVLEYGDNNEIVLFDKILSIDDIIGIDNLIVENQWSDSVWDMKDTLSSFQDNFSFKLKYDVQPKLGFLSTKEFEIDVLEKSAELL